MSSKITINIEDRVFEFLNRSTSNRSAYINALILQKEQEELKEKLRLAYREQNQSSEFQQAIKDWNSAVGDGVDEA